MKFDKTELIDAMQTVADELENAMKEIKMWRELAISEKKILGFSSMNLEQSFFFDERIRNAPIGIEDIEEFIDLQLKCYRDIQEKIK